MQYFYWIQYFLMTIFREKLFFQQKKYFFLAFEICILPKMLYLICNDNDVVNDASPSSRGLGHRVFIPATRVRIPVGMPFFFACIAAQLVPCCRRSLGRVQSYTPSFSPRQNTTCIHAAAQKTCCVLFFYFDSVW